MPISASPIFPHQNRILSVVLWVGLSSRPSQQCTSCLQHLGLPWFLTLLLGSIQQTGHLPYFHDSVLTHSEQKTILIIKVHVDYAMLHFMKFGQ